MRACIKKSLLLFVLGVFLLITPSVHAAGPAGVDTGLKLWFSADSGVKALGGDDAINGDEVDEWEDQSADARTATRQSSGGATYSTTGLNYNPTLNFNGNYYTFSDTGLPSGSSDRTIFVVATTNDIGNWRYVLGTGTFGSGRSFDFGNRSGSGTVFITTHSSQEVQAGSWSPLGGARLAVGGVTGAAVVLGINGASLTTGGSGVNTVLDGSGNIGSNSNSGEFWNGSVSEVIMYNSFLGATDRQRINSYLALKYGFSLDQSTAQSYLASGSNLMWDKDATGASTYDNGLFGIGRDDSSNLAQIKSRGQTSTNVIVLQAVGEGSNGNPSFTDMNNLEFLVIGDDNGAATWTTTGAPTGYSILAKQWKKQEQGDIGSVTMDFDVADSDFNIPAPLDSGNYYFIYDTDNDNSLTDETPQSMTDQGSNLWRVTVDFGSGGLFTLASTQNPAIVSLSPADNSTSASSSTNLVIQFSQSVTVDTGSITIHKTSDDSTVETISVGSGQVTGSGTDTITINPANNLTGGVEYYVLIPSTAFKNGSNYFGGISTTAGWSFTVADSSAPTFTNISASTASNTTATVSWTTNEAASTRVSYGLTTAYGTTTSETDTSPRVTSHSVNLSSLLACTTYHYQVLSTDGASNVGTSSDQTFTTPGCQSDATPESTKSESITVSSGGTTTLTQSNTQLSVEAPANVTNAASSIVIQIKALPNTSILSALGRPTAVPKEIGDIVFDVKAIINSTTILDSFDSPITITYQYTDADVSGKKESTFWLYHYHNGAWTALDDCTVTMSTNTISCSTDSFSVFGLFGQQETASAAVAGSGLGECSAIKPSGTSDVFQINTSSNKATIFFTPLHSGVTNYYVAYGYKEGEERFGTFTGLGPSSGVLTYTINELDPNTTYYFKIRPQNGCAPGEWSNSMKATTVKKNASAAKHYKNIIARVYSYLPRETADVHSVNVMGANTKVKPSKAKTQVPSKKMTASCDYVVQVNENLWKIAQKKLGDGARYTEIMQENNFVDPVVNPGMKLKIGC